MIERESVGERGSDSKSERDRKRDIVCVCEGGRHRRIERERERGSERERRLTRQRERLRVGDTESQKDRETEKQRDGETERQNTQNIHTRTRLLFP